VAATRAAGSSAGQGTAGPAAVTMSSAGWAATARRRSSRHRTAAS
jgi:hypothetical protein